MSHTYTNLFLQALPKADRNLLLSRSQAISMPQKLLLYEPGRQPPHAYFLTSGIFSSVVTMTDGESVEVGITGREGVVNGLSVLGPANVVTQGVIQVEATGYQIALTELRKAFRSSERIHDRLLEFVQNEAGTGTRIAGCNRLHSTEQRLARWLLMVQDRVQSDELNLTQTFLGVMLGAGRPTVTLVAGALQDRGLLRLHRGQVKILDRERLEAVACECYQTAKQHFAALYSSIS